MRSALLFALVFVGASAFHHSDSQGSGSGSGSSLVGYYNEEEGQVFSSENHGADSKFPRSSKNDHGAYDGHALSLASTYPKELSPGPNKKLVMTCTYSFQSNEELGYLTSLTISKRGVDVEENNLIAGITVFENHTVFLPQNKDKLHVSRENGKILKHGDSYLTLEWEDTDNHVLGVYVCNALFVSNLGNLTKLYTSVTISEQQTPPADSYVSNDHSSHNHGTYNNVALSMGTDYSKISFPGADKSLVLNCSFRFSPNEELGSLISLGISKRSKDGPPYSYNKLAGISILDPNTVHSSEEALHYSRKSGHFRKNGDSFVSLEWDNTDDRCVGVYFCKALFMSKLGHVKKLYTPGIVKKYEIASPPLIINNENVQISAEPQILTPGGAQPLEITCKYHQTPDHVLGNLNSLIISKLDTTSTPFRWVELAGITRLEDAVIIKDNDIHLYTGRGMLKAGEENAFLTLEWGIMTGMEAHLTGKYKCDAHLSSNMGKPSADLATVDITMAQPEAPVASETAPETSQGAGGPGQTENSNRGQNTIAGPSYQNFNDMIAERLHAHLTNQGDGRPLISSGVDVEEGILQGSDKEERYSEDDEGAEG